MLRKWNAGWVWRRRAAQPAFVFRDAAEMERRLGVAASGRATGVRFPGCCGNGTPVGCGGVGPRNRRSFAGMLRKWNAGWVWRRRAAQPAFVFRDAAEMERRLGGGGWGRAAGGRRAGAGGDGTA